MDTTQWLRECELSVRVEASGSDRIRRLGRSVARFSTLFRNRRPARRAAAPATRAIERAFYGHRPGVWETTPAVVSRRSQFLRCASMRLPHRLPSPFIRRWAPLLLMLTFAGGDLAGRHSVAGEAWALLREAEQGGNPQDIGATGAAECRRRKRPVRIRLSSRRWPHIADHIRDVHRTHRWPRVWYIDRRGADENRDQSIEHWEQTRGRRFSEAERRGKDRDEVPPAIAREGGRWRGRYADVRLVNSHENRSAGAYLGNRLGPWCNGQRFVLVGRSPRSAAD
jgi:hypothetical protein